jgi:DNA-binding NarL/FixJ family response regulator
MQKKDGVDVLQWLTLHQPSLKVIMVSAYSYGQYIQEVLSLGADAYVCKAQLPSEILAAITLVATSPKRKPSPVSSAKSISNYLSLTNREKEILELSSSDLTYKEIAKQLYVSENTIEKHRANLFKKLNVTTRVGLVIKSLKNGWIKW